MLLADKVEINWTTESEVNNYGFDLERKVNVSSWIKLGFVSGNGNSNTPKTYSFIDNSLLGGSKFYYRLKQIDTDGSFEYSDIVSVEFLPQKFSLEQNYPNPFNPTTKIRWQSPVGSHQTLKIYDVLGNEVSTLVDEYLPAGSYETEFNADGLSSGIYFYKLQAGSFVETKKMILIK
ncbi:MAG: T9SS type A sorting domain-containing protein [bacterium]|nr:T9SS type A sorting domain-containing protein [bacterium]